MALPVSSKTLHDGVETGMNRRKRKCEPPISVANALCVNMENTEYAGYARDEHVIVGIKVRVRNPYMLGIPAPSPRMSCIQIPYGTAEIHTSGVGANSSAISPLILES
ncbi:hypothetical protein ABEW05_010201 [Botrytis cinerea]